MRYVVVAACRRVDREAEQSGGSGWDVDGGVDARPGDAGGFGGGVLNVTKLLLAISVVSKFRGDDGVGVLANWMVWSPLIAGPSVVLTNATGRDSQSH